jgi:hypothetical protein
MGQAHIRLDPLNACTAIPSIEGLYFTLDFTAEGKTAVNTDLKSGLTLTVALESGDWTLEVKGYSGHTETSIGSLVVRGTSSVSITAGISSPVTVYLTPDFSSGGTGTLFYNVDFPESRAFLSMHPLSAQGTGQEIDISESAEGSITDLPAGTYQAFIDLYSTNNTAMVWTGVVHIYNGSTTSLTPSFTAPNFAACPPELGKDENTLAAKLEAALASPSGSYTIVLDDKVTESPQTLNVTGNKDITIAIRGNGQTVQLGSNGSLFTLNPESGSKLTLVVQDITLKGRSSNNAPMVQVNSGGTLEVKVGSNLTGNTFSVKGGGVSVASGGFLNMSGGEISGNTSAGNNYGGGGVYLASDATFTMTDGVIYGSESANGSKKNTGSGAAIFGGTPGTTNETIDKRTP